MILVVYEFTFVWPQTNKQHSLFVGFFFCLLKSPTLIMTSLHQSRCV